MSLIIPRQGSCFKEVSSALVSNAEFGISVPSSSTVNTKGSPVELIASTPYTSYGIVVGLGATTIASTNTSTLVDIMIGGSGSEQVLIPNLMCGNAGGSDTSTGQPVHYYFPIIIGSGVRLSARAQSALSTHDPFIQLHMFPSPIPGKWYGSRVTDYGTNTGTSSGTSHTPNGSGTTYATTTQITASTANPIRALQVGIDLLGDTTATNARGVLRIAAGSSTNYIVDSLAFREVASSELIDATIANLMLSHMVFDIPASSYLGVGAMMSTAEARGFALYGVD